jgi:nucleotide-binding universal stress UspA family protein
MYRNILVPIAIDTEHDPSRSLEIARVLAAPEARITLLHVIEHAPRYAMSYMPQDLVEETRLGLAAELDRLAATLPNAAGEVVVGHSGRSILDWVEANVPDLIIMESHRPGMQDLLLGSTASHVVRHAPCSVHVLR